jgi:hypothetical protein
MMSRLSIVVVKYYKKRFQAERVGSQDESHTTSGGMYLTLCFTYATFLLQAMNELDLGNYELEGNSRMAN